MADKQYPDVSNSLKRLVDTGDGFHAEQFALAGAAMSDDTPAGFQHIYADTSRTAAYDQNRLFKVFEEILIGSANGDQVVFNITAINPVEFFYRDISINTGGLSIRTYADDGSHTITGSFGTPVSAQPLNYDTTRSGLPAPLSSTIQIAQLAGNDVFVAGSGATSGSSLRTANVSSQSSGAFASNNVRFGTPANLSTFLVLTKLSGVNAITNGELVLYFEEIFQ